MFRIDRSKDTSFFIFASISLISIASTFFKNHFVVGYLGSSTGWHLLLLFGTSLMSLCFLLSSFYFPVSFQTLNCLSVWISPSQNCSWLLFSVPCSCLWMAWVMKIGLTRLPSVLFCSIIQCLPQSYYVYYIAFLSYRLQKTCSTINFHSFG